MPIQKKYHFSKIKSLHVKVKTPPQEIKRTSYFKSLNKENHIKSLAIIIFHIYHKGLLEI